METILLIFAVLIISLISHTKFPSGIVVLHIPLEK